MELKLVVLVLLATFSVCQSDSSESDIDSSESNTDYVYSDEEDYLEYREQERERDSENSDERGNPAEALKPGREPMPSERLINHLFSGRYNDYIIPGNVSLHLGLRLICALYDPATHILTSRVWQEMSWEDHRLMWDPRDYGGVEEVSVNAYQLWRPDIKVYNSIEQEEVDWDARAIISSTGHVMWIPPATYKTLCTGQGSSINCKLELGSWTYDGLALQLAQYEGPVNTNQYLPECPYKVNSIKSSFQVKYYDCCAEPYNLMNSEFSIEKK